MQTTALAALAAFVFAYVPTPARFTQVTSASPTADGAWSITESVDEMTDVKGYAISAVGTLDGEGERPVLVVEVARQVGEFEDLFRRPSNQSRKVTYEARIVLACGESLDSAKSVLVRFDGKDAAEWPVRANESLRALHLDRARANDFANAMLSAKTLLVRYTAFPGKPRTARFSLDGFAERFAETKARMRKR